MTDPMGYATDELERLLDEEEQYQLRRWAACAYAPPQELRSKIEFDNFSEK